MPRRRRSVLPAGVIVAALLAASCSNDDSATAPTDPVRQSSNAAPSSSVSSSRPPRGPAASTTTVAGGVSGATVPTVPDSAPPAGSAAPDTSLVPSTDPPQTGVPGTGSGDVFCEYYGTMLATEYLIGLAEAFGDEAGARRAEIVASTSFLAAFVGAGETLGGFDTEGAFTRRWARLGERAAVAGSAASVGADVLDEAWSAVLRDHDRNDPTITLPLDPDTSAAVDLAAATVEEQLGPLMSDAAYLESVAVPTDGIQAHLRVSCPDVAALAAGDAI